MVTGAGKGWARGKTAASDPRIARAAAAHTGLTYKRRTPRRARGPASFDWTPDMAYAVGLIATDGCLIERGRSVAFVSKDSQLVETLMRCIGREPKLRIDHTRLGRELYRFQINDRVLYQWLERAGLTPRKSLTLGPIHVPDDLFAHVVRGLLDGEAASSTRSGVPTRLVGPTTSTSGFVRNSSQGAQSISSGFTAACARRSDCMAGSAQDRRPVATRATSSSSESTIPYASWLGSTRTVRRRASCESARSGTTTPAVMRTWCRPLANIVTSRPEWRSW